MSLIEKEYLLNALNTFNDKWNGIKHFMNGIEMAKEIIRNAPVVDGVPVTRCEECEHGMDDLFHSGYTICNFMRCTMKNDGYCSNALRRE